MTRKILMLVATKTTQGWRQNDYCETSEGEVVIPIKQCKSKDRDECVKIDSACGCRRMMVGIESCNCTTTARAIEINKPEDAIKKQILYCYREIGRDCRHTLSELKQMADRDYDWNRTIAEKVGIGAVIERRGGRYKMRGNIYER